MLPPRQRPGESDLEWAKRVHAYVHAEVRRLQILVPILVVLWFMVMLAVFVQCALKQ